MKKILVLTSRFPYPVIGGDKLRIYQICKELSKKYELTLISLCESREELELSVPDDGVFSTVERVYLSRWRSYWNSLLAIPTSTPLQVAYYKSDEFAKKVDDLLGSHDAVLSHLIRTAEYVKDKKIPKILEMTDAISLNYKRVSEVGDVSGLKALIYKFEVSRLFSYEQAISNSFDMSVLVSDVDRKYLSRQSSGGNLLVCSNGVDVDSLPYKCPDIDSKVVIFIGNMRSVQNTDACSYFIEEVLPLLRSKGDYRFRIVGSIDDDLAQEFGKYSGVELTGRVDSIVSAAQAGAVGICPMRIGAGVQNKVLEYMSLGLPVVTTALGLEGISAQAGHELIVADSKNEIAEAIEYLCSSPESAYEISERARSFVEDKHDWSSILSNLVDSVERIVE